MVHVGLPLVILQGTQVQLVRVGPVSGRTPLVQVGITGVVGGLVFTPLAAILDMLFPESDGGPTEPFLAALLSEAVSVIPAVTLVWLGVNAPRLMQPGRPAPPSADPDFWTKVPAALGDDLISLSAELHYTRARTASGEALVLYSFGQDIRKADPAIGLQVHRSHWIAFQHISSVKRKREQAEATLSSGDVIPVSRRYRGDLFTALKTEGLARVIHA